MIRRHEPCKDPGPEHSRQGKSRQEVPEVGMDLRSSKGRRRPVCVLESRRELGARRRWERQTKVMSARGRWRLEASGEFEQGGTWRVVL